MRCPMLSMFFVLCVLLSIAVVAKPLKSHESSESGINTDNLFLERMIAYHEYGIKLANLGQIDAITPSIKKEAEQVLKIQIEEARELRKLKRIFLKEKQSKIAGPVDHISELKKLKGKDFDETFCLRMSMHFEDGVAMIRKALPSLTVKRIKVQATNLLKTQSKSLRKFEELEEETHKN